MEIDRKTWPIVRSLCRRDLNFYMVIDIPTMSVSKRRGRYSELIEEFAHTGCTEVNQFAIDQILSSHDGFM